MDERERVKTLQHPIRAELYAELRTAAATGLEPAIGADELAERLVEAGHQVDHATVAYHLLQLERVGLVAFDDRGWRSLT